jgi:hypothetical protein
VIVINVAPLPNGTLLGLRLVIVGLLLENTTKLIALLVPPSDPLEVGLITSTGMPGFAVAMLASGMKAVRFPVLLSYVTDVALSTLLPNFTSD